MRPSATLLIRSAPIGSAATWLVELVHGARTTLLVAIAAAAMALGIGTLVGTLAGFLGGLADEVLMRITEAFQTVPAFLLALAFISVTGPTRVDHRARHRARRLDSAGADRAGAGARRCASAISSPARARDRHEAAGDRAARSAAQRAARRCVSLAAVIVAGAVLIEAALSFLGLGDPNRVTWGSMIAEGGRCCGGAPFLSIVPGLALVTDGARGVSRRRSARSRPTRGERPRMSTRCFSRCRMSG